MRKVGAALLAFLLAGLSGGTARAQDGGRPRTAAPRAAETTSRLNGVYRIDINGSDKLYSVVEGVSSNLPFGEQQRFFIDLAVRLTPPDLLAVERRGRRVTIGSSRAPRITLVADGITRAERATDGHLVRSRVALEGDKLTFTSSGRTEDNFSVIFAPIDQGRRLRVTRRISAEQLNEPVIIQTVYEKISDSARWDIYGEATQSARATGGDNDNTAPTTTAPGTPPARVPAASTRPDAPGASASGVESDQAAALRASLDSWVGATNAHDIEKQMSFYVPELQAFYLTRNVARAAVRAEKVRVFRSASLIDIRAEEPEIIFRGGGREAIMRFRKRYRVDDGARSRRGEVIQELRWRRTREGWRIFSERDIKVIR